MNSRGFADFGAWAYGNTSRLCRRNSAPSPPKPRGGPSALAGARGEAGQARCLAAHTHALFAQKVQRKVSNSVAPLAAAGAIDFAAIRGSTNRRPKSQQPIPSCLSHRPQLKREASLWPRVRPSPL